MMLDARCSILDAGKGSSIQDRASSIEFVPLWLNGYDFSISDFGLGINPQFAIRDSQFAIRNQIISWIWISDFGFSHFGFRHRFKSLLEKGEIGLHFLFSNRNTKKSQTGFQSGKRLFMFAAHIA
ncbi:MAG: hypothetical protein AB1797_08320 [bacterium]